MFVGEVLAVQGYTVRFRVIEPFLNADSAEFTARIVSDLYFNDVPQHVPAFAVGENWLLESNRRFPGETWTTGNCTRTKTVQSATDDLRVLRTWLAGQSRPAELSGEIWDPVQRKSFVGITISLIGSKRTLSTRSDSRGVFAFNNLEPGEYELEALLESGPVRRRIDLLHAWCARVVISPQ